MELSEVEGVGVVVYVFIGENRLLGNIGRSGACIIEEFGFVLSVKVVLDIHKLVQSGVLVNIRDDKE